MSIYITYDIYSPHLEPQKHIEFFTPKKGGNFQSNHLPASTRDPDKRCTTWQQWRWTREPANLKRGWGNDAFSNKVSSDHLTHALYYCIPLLSFPGCKKSRFFLSWTPCRCLISVKNSPQKKWWIYHSKLEKSCSQKAIPCLWAIIHRHILSGNSSPLDASNIGKHLQFGKMHHFFG